MRAGAAQNESCTPLPTKNEKTPNFGVRIRGLAPGPMHDPNPNLIFAGSENDGIGQAITRHIGYN